MDSLKFSTILRKKTLEMVYYAKASHIGGALSITDIIAILYSKILKIQPKNPNWKMRDRFVLSKGHCCSVLYAALALRGFFNKNKLNSYAKDHSLLMSHASHKIPGVEFSTGSLGHGLPYAAGKAYISKYQKTNWKSYVLISDGELNEGSNWESIIFAAQHKLDNLIAIIDYNKLQGLGKTKNILNLEPLRKKFESFGWSVKQIDGHDHKKLQKTLTKLPWKKNKPSVLIANTVKGKGVSFMENNNEWHYKSPSKDQLKLALEELENA